MGLKIGETAEMEESRIRCTLIQWLAKRMKLQNSLVWALPAPAPCSINRLQYPQGGLIDAVQNPVQEIEIIFQIVFGVLVLSVCLSVFLFEEVYVCSYSLISLCFRVCLYLPVCVIVVFRLSILSVCLWYVVVDVCLFMIAFVCLYVFMSVCLCVVYRYV